MRRNRTRRLLLCLGLVCVLLGSAGCGIFSKNKSPGGTRPFTGLPTSGSGSQDPILPSSGSGAGRRGSPLPPQVNGLLAGQVGDKFRKNPAGVVIQVVDLQEQKSGKAPIDIYANDEGYFTIQGLEPGRNYKLVARVKEGTTVLTGTTFASPPNPRLFILLGEDLTGENTPPIPKPPAWPGENKQPGSAGPLAEPAASLEPPKSARRDQKGTGETGRSPPASVPPTPPSPVIPDRRAPSPPAFEPSRTATHGEFLRDPAVTIPSIPRPSTTVPAQPSLPPLPRHSPGTPLSIPGPGVDSLHRGLGTAPEITPASVPPTFDTKPTPAPVTPIGSLPSPTSKIPVPSCVLVGNRLHNMSLFDLNGQAWEYRKDRAGRLLLLDFWSTSCVPCVRALPHLEGLQRRYGTQGLQVLGIAYEKGPREQQAERVRQVKARTNTSYLTLLGGGGQGPCPVQRQFGVSSIPTLVLLDEEGNILWRSRNGIDETQFNELEWMIRNQLSPATR